MSTAVTSREWLVVLAIIAGALAVDWLLPIDGLPSLLLVVFVVLIGVFGLVPGAWRSLYRATGVGVRAWLLAAAIAGSGIAVSYLLGDPQPYCEGINPYRGCLSAYGWASTVFVGSMLGVAVAVGHLGHYRRLRAATLSAASEAREGVVAVEGRIEPAGNALEAPVTGTDAVWHRQALERSTVFGWHREIDSTTTGTRFFVSDGSGRLLVLPDSIDAHVAAEFATSHTSNGDGERRREWRYEPTDAVTVVGRASEVSRAEYPEPVAVGLDGPVILARRTLDELRAWAAQRVIVGGVLAILVGGLTFVGMLLTA